LSIRALVAKLQPDKVVWWCPGGDFWVLHFRPAAWTAWSTFQTCILNSHGVWKSMVDIQCATAETRRGEKRKKKKKQDENIMSPYVTQGGHKYGTY